MNNQNIKFSIGIVGDTNIWTGKTSILNVYNERNFKINITSTNGLNSIKTIIQKNNEIINKILYMLQQMNDIENLYLIWLKMN